MAFPRVAVGVAGTATSWQALAWAADEAAATGGHLVICHGCPAESVLGRYPAAVPMAVLELADPPLARAVAATRARLGGERVSVRIRPEHHAVALLADAARDADVLVLGAPSSRGWREITHRLLGHVPVPTIVVRPVTGPAGPFAGHVVVGVDGSEPSAGGLELAFRYAATHRVPLAAVHATADAPDDFWFDDTMLEAHFPAEPAGLRLLAEQVEPWTHKYPDVRVKRAVYTGRALPALLRAAAGARLLALGARGHGVAARVLLGSVSHGVVDQAGGPVAVVPSMGAPR
ncbi:universal stress protein [Phytohabitans aurantiacus]|uniref:Universal stress protein n=1 Tax=Phytohabitans aurantiacus TaxID=3016789 RepID=A0ABQ5R3E4_9ACTN|nr:universal stress protein [Phytohabitans aurantiacus]GLI01061.1 universal stress protein [Phytohabitans aurantiacus]